MAKRRSNQEYLAHCVNAVEAGNEARCPGSLCLIDGAILGGLHIDTEHEYRQAHNRDYEQMLSRVETRFF